MHLIDRQGIAADVLKGMAAPMLTPVFPDSADYPLVSDIIDRLSPRFDPALFVQKLSTLLRDAGGEFRDGQFRMRGEAISVSVDAGGGLGPVASAISKALAGSGFLVQPSPVARVPRLTLERVPLDPPGFDLYTEYVIGRLVDLPEAKRLAAGHFSSEGERIQLLRHVIEYALTESPVAYVIAELDLFFYNSSRQGVENIAYDRFSGPDSYWFYRTIKLKEFVWNGWLRIGVPKFHSTPYPPLGGFGANERGVWMAISDSAGWAHPRLGGWYPMRVRWSTDQVTSIPPSWQLNIRDGKFESIPALSGTFYRLTYRILMSDFHDGEPMTAADLVYGLYYRLRAEPAAKGPIAIRIVRDNEVLKAVSVGDVIARIYKVTTIEMYLPTRPDLGVSANLAPYSPIPWQLYVLGEASGQSHSLDLAYGLPSVRPVLERMASEAYVPPLLRELVSMEEARARWAKLRQWAEEHENLLVANGPYYVHSISSGEIVVRVFRDFTYPFGIGEFDHLASHDVPKVQGLSPLTIERGRPAELNVVLTSASWPLNNSGVDYLILTKDGRLLASGAAQRLPSSREISFRIMLSPNQTASLERADLTIRLVAISPDSGVAAATQSTLAVLGGDFALPTNWVDLFSYGVAIAAAAITLLVIARSEGQRRRRGRREGRHGC